MTYSVISDDWLQFSTDKLIKMEADFIAEHGTPDTGIPSKGIPTRPFGENGSRFSSPLKILLDDRAISDLLMFIEETAKN